MDLAKFDAIDILHRKIDEVASDHDIEIRIAAWAIVRLRHAAEHIEEAIINGSR